MAKSSSGKMHREKYVQKGLETFQETIKDMSGVELKKLLKDKFNTVTHYSDKSRKKLTDSLVAKETRKLYNEFEAKNEAPQEVRDAIEAEAPENRVEKHPVAIQTQLGHWYVTGGSFLLMVTGMDIEANTIETVGFDSDGNWLKEKEMSALETGDWASAPITLVNKTLKKEAIRLEFKNGSTVLSPMGIRQYVTGDKIRYNAKECTLTIGGTTIFKDGGWYTVDSQEKFYVGQSVMFNESPTKENVFWMPAMKKFEGMIGEVSNITINTLTINYGDDYAKWAFPKEIFFEIVGNEFEAINKDSKVVKLKNPAMDAGAVPGCPTHATLSENYPVGEFNDEETTYTVSYASKHDLVQQVFEETGKKIKCNIFTTKEQLEYRAVEALSKVTPFKTVCKYIK